MKLIIINYGSGNLHSVNKAFEVANQNLEKPYDIQVTDDPEIVKLADKIVLPGVGAFAGFAKSAEDHYEFCGYFSNKGLKPGC